MCDHLWVEVLDGLEDYHWFLGPKASFDAMGFKSNDAKLFCHKIRSLYWEMHVDVYDPDIPF